VAIGLIRKAGLRPPRVSSNPLDRLASRRARARDRTVMSGRLGGAMRLRLRLLWLIVETVFKKRRSLADEHVLNLRVTSE
jgi:hypothetical protein